LSSSYVESLLAELAEHLAVSRPEAGVDSCVLSAQDAPNAGDVKNIEGLQGGAVMAPQADADTGDGTAGKANLVSRAELALHTSDVRKLVDGALQQMGAMQTRMLDAFGGQLKKFELGNNERAAAAGDRFDALDSRAMDTDKRFDALEARLSHVALQLGDALSQRVEAAEQRAASAIERLVAVEARISLSAAPSCAAFHVEAPAGHVPLNADAPSFVPDLPTGNAEGHPAGPELPGGEASGPPELVGETVSLVGLVAKSELNGSIGLVESFAADTERFSVRLGPASVDCVGRTGCPGRVVWVRRQNLSFPAVCSKCGAEVTSSACFACS